MTLEQKKKSYRLETLLGCLIGLLIYAFATGVIQREIKEINSLYKIASLKKSTLSIDSTITIGTAFDKYKYFRETPSWEYFETEKGRQIIEVSGDYDLEGFPDKLTIFVRFVRNVADVTDGDDFYLFEAIYELNSNIAVVDANRVARSIYEDNELPIPWRFEKYLKKNNAIGN